MKKKLFLLLIVLFLTTGVLPGCAREHGLDPDNPVTLALWHNYGGQMQKTMDALVDEFNNTVGKEKGVVLNVTSISSSASLHEKLTMAASGDPGAPALPDITTCYPKTALTLAGKDKLVNLDSQFTGKELAAYLPRFIEEGRLEDKDGGLYVFPIAKSTEVLFVNQTLFDRFSQATGVTVACFDTPEGIADAAVKYRDWTDSQTPDTPGDGKAFYTSDAPFNYAQIGMAQQGEGLIEKESLNLDNAAFKKIWDSYYAPSVKGALPSLTAIPQTCPRPERSSAPPAPLPEFCFTVTPSLTRTAGPRMWSTRCCPTRSLRTARRSPCSAAAVWL